LRVIGNIPYNITSEIVFKLIDNRQVIKDAQLMIQEEVARRLASRPGSKEYGIPSVLVQAFSKPGLKFKVSRNCFYPKPNVDSRIIYFDFAESREKEITNTEFFKRFVKASFSSRRKTMRNSLKPLNLELNKSDFDFSRRAESLSVKEFIDLSNLFCSTT
jgi:16S rRNA (adenine1518-N6/adenine1519-N6)-dimethyltransferase